jgi:hypothetical protein
MRGLGHDGTFPHAVSQNYTRLLQITREHVTRHAQSVDRVETGRKMAA